MNAQSQSSVDEELKRLSDTKSLSRLAFWILGVGFGGFVAWSAFVPLDQGVPSMGNVVIDTKRRPVQHSSGGTVAEIFVKEGDIVKSGQLLLRFGDSTAKANVQTAQSSLNALRESLKGQEALVSGLQRVRPTREGQLALLRKEYSGLVGLVEQGYAPVTQRNDLERRMADLQASLDDLTTQEVRAKQSVLELGHQIRAAEERLSIAQKDLERTRVFAPADGQVMNLQAASPGRVIAGGEKMMELVPAQEGLVIEAQIEPTLIDRVAEGDPVDIMFMTFSYTPQLVVEGRVESLSRDILTDPRGGDPRITKPYYLARISVTSAGMKALDGRQMQAGMPVTVVVKTGSRTLLSYLVSPLTRRISQSMREE